MKKLILIASMIIPIIGISQTSISNPDTVCYQSSTPSTYTVPTVGSGTYTWTVISPGTITAGQGTNSISVNWSSASPGLINNGVSVIYNSPSPANCPSSVVNLNVLIYRVIPTITAVGPFCESDPCVVLNATPTGGSFSGNGISGNQFCPDNITNGSNATSTITYTLISGGCTFSTTTVIPVYGTPSLSPIQHN
jgi:hypothetical protein